jgi:quercetin dioxygenase-like cupin family protein
MSELRVVRHASERVDNVVITLDAAATDGAFSVLELTLEPGQGSNRHRHTAEIEAFVVLSGTLVITTDDADHRLASGDAVVLPRDITHAFVNAGEEPMRALIITAPAGLERFFRDLAAGTDDEEASRRAGLAPG